MDFAKAIRARRQELGLSPAAVAGLCGLTIHEYCDIEQHADEFETAISTKKARDLCHALSIGFRDFIGLSTDASRQFEGIGPARLVRDARERAKMSQGELSDLIGFELDTIRRLETEDDFADTLPLAVLRDLERLLAIERGALVCEGYRGVRKNSHAP
jgi:transcriptional regulator with XRE-family HTH domain